MNSELEVATLPYHGSSSYPKKGIGPLIFRCSGAARSRQPLFTANYSTS